MHISTRNIYGISYARSYRTLRDGSFEDAFPGTSCQATIGVSLRDGLAEKRHGIWYLTCPRILFRNSAGMQRLIQKGTMTLKLPQRLRLGLLSVLMMVVGGRASAKNENTSGLLGGDLAFARTHSDYFEFFHQIGRAHV